MNCSRRIGRCAAPALAASMVLMASLTQPAAAQTSPDEAARVVTIEHRTVGIVRRVESIKGEIRTEEGPKQIEVTLAADVLFDFDKADLTPTASTRIAEVAQQIRARAKGPVAVVGFTDAKGTGAYNADLSLRRATAVRQALQPKAPSSTYTVAGKGAADPVAPNTNTDGSDNPAGRAMNRRVTITFGR